MGKLFEKLVAEQCGSIGRSSPDRTGKRQIKNQLNFVSYWYAPSGWSAKMALPVEGSKEKMLV